MADATPATTPPAAPSGTAPESPVDDGKGGKAAVLADLATERDKRQALEQQVTQLTQAQQAQTEALAKAFGLKPEETSDVSALAQEVSTLREQFTATQHTNLVLTVANDNGISDKDDLALLSAVTDEAQLRALAARLAKANEGTTTPGTPKPDLTQGGKGGSGQGSSPADDFARVLGAQLGG